MTSFPEEPLIRSLLADAKDQAKALYAESIENKTGCVNEITIPVPSLCLRYLFQLDGFPVSKFVIITGPYASFKSTLSLEIARWHYEMRGAAALFDTEGSSSPLSAALLKRNILTKTYQHLEDWIADLRNLATQVQQEMNSGVVAPVCFIIDSIVGSESKKMSEKFEQDLMSIATYPVESKIISVLLKHKNSILNGYPITLIGTSHIKHNINPYGGPERYLPGGAALVYHAQLIIEVCKEKAPELKTEGYETLIKLTMLKNRFGPEKLSIVVPFMVRQVGDSDVQLDAKFLWHTATIKLLSEGLGINIRTRDKLLNRVKAVVNIESRSAGSKGTKYYCNELGVSKEEAVSAEELGAILEQNETILKELYKIFAIRKTEPLIVFDSRTKNEPKE